MNKGNNMNSYAVNYDSQWEAVLFINHAVSSNLMPLDNQCNIINLNTFPRSSGHVINRIYDHECKIMLSH